MQLKLWLIKKQDTVKADFWGCTLKGQTTEMTARFNPTKTTKVDKYSNKELPSCNMS